MLYDLKNFGISKGYFEIKRIRDFNDAQRQGIHGLNTPAIEFDETKDIVCREFNLDPCKSCDALDIQDSKNIINFIEFKQIDDINLDQHIEDINISQKIKDSHFILKHIVNKRELIHPAKANKFKNCRKKVIIVYDLRMNAIKRIFSHMRHLSFRSRLNKEIEENNIIGENIEEPIYMKISDFDIKYPQIN